MKLQILYPAKKLKASYQRLHIDREKIELFKENIKKAFEDIAIADKKKESEEHYKAIVRDFLLDTYYKGNHSINTQGRNDLVIHNGSNAISPVGIIIETKQPSNKSEMISAKNSNSKSFQQLITYFLKERFENKNLEIKHLIISNIYEWYIFDAGDFERYFYDNKKIKDSYLDWTNKTSLMSKTDWFYKEVLFPHIEENLESIPCTYFNLKEYESNINNDNLEDDEDLLDLYKILSPEHLLKKQIANDNNSLNKQFYAELLHILGIEEVKEGSKKTIKRCAKSNEGSILENTLAKLKPKARDLSETESYEIALELTITWLNRILFLKLLEGQLIKYNNNPDFAFLNYKKVNEYDVLEELFFEVLAVNYKERPESIQKIYGNIPYLNSSLFEETELERKYFGINVLKDRLDIPIYSNTVLNFQVKGSSKRTLEYLLEFLDAYDFGDESKGKIKDKPKSIITASVLGLIFEKINGYKDGSFFTPSFITMYMCRESIRRAVVQKFNDTYGWKCEEFTDLKNEIKSIKKKDASDTLNTLRICDPAVGSGHFLVSALNELITIKQDLKILIDSEGVDLSEYTIDIENDELVIKDERGIPYSYLFQKKESRRIQETLFREKQTIIENCLFGVDINPKSVMICRLRLWIELLKNAYYTESSKYKELETLPNIDINIKCGNSLISRFEVKDSHTQWLPKDRLRIHKATEEYKLEVELYKTTDDKAIKRRAFQKIEEIKKIFSSIVIPNDADYKKLDQANQKLHKKQTEIPFGNQKERDLWTEEIRKLSEEAQILSVAYEEKQRTLYANAFEWRFEFPEVLDEKGGFVGFDVVIGNPPYISHDKIENHSFIKDNYKVFEAFSDLYCYFFELSIRVIKNNGVLNLITSNSFLKAEYGKPLRKLFYENGTFSNLINIDDAQIFEDAIVNTCIVDFNKSNFKLNSRIVNKKYDYRSSFNQFLIENVFYYSHADFDTSSWNLLPPNQLKLISKIKSKGVSLEKLNTKIRLGIATGSNEAFVIDKKVADSFISKNAKNQDIIKPLIRGRDIDRFLFKQEKYILLTKNGINVEKDYPDIFNYLDSFGDEFKKRGAKGQHWTNLRACAFFDDFTLPKIAWIELSDENRFAFVENEMYLLNSAYFLIPPVSIDPFYLLGILNSKLIKFYLSSIANTSGMGTTRWINIYVKEFPIIDLENKKQQPFINLVTQILSLKKSNPESETTDLEAEIDQLVYELYGLSEEEIAIVENKS